jgi:hypothetical protein
MPLSIRRAVRGAPIRRAVPCALFLLIAASPAIAHHPGGGGNAGGAGPINTMSASTLEAGHGVAGITIAYTRLNTLSNTTLVGATAAGIDGVHDLKTLRSYALAGAYGVTNDLMISFHLPYVKRTGIRAAEVDADTGGIEIEDHGGSDGIGDVSLLGQYRFFTDTQSRTEAALLLGLKAATGPTGRRSRQGELLDAEFQPGSGAWGGQFGLAVTHRSGPWSFDANMLYELSTEGTQSTDLGDLFMYNAAVSLRLMGRTGPVPMFHGHAHHDDGDDGRAHTSAAEKSSGPALDLILELNGQIHDNQVQSGVTDENSGGHTLMISPGLRVSLGNVSGFASVAIPIVNDFNGIQPDNDWRLTTGMMVAF